MTMRTEALVAATRPADISRGANERPSASLEKSWYLIVVVLGIGLLWAGLYYWERYFKRTVRRDATPQSLFRDLCAAHELSRGERALLEALVERKRLEHPAVAFVVPALLLEMQAEDGDQAAEYARLARKLFGPHYGPGASLGAGMRVTMSGDDDAKSII
ncbi:MAG: hypothetical protein WD066_15075 [Planctomycetaceae bacterium]